MRLVIRLHGPEQAEVVGEFGKVWEEIRDHHAALATWTNRQDRSHGKELVDSKSDLIIVDGSLNSLAVIPCDEILGVEEIRLRRPTLHKEKNDTSSSRRYPEIVRPLSTRTRSGTGKIGRHGMERETAKTTHRGSQPLSARHFRDQETHRVNSRSVFRDLSTAHEKLVRHEDRVAEIFPAPALRARNKFHRVALFLG